MIVTYCSQKGGTIGEVVFSHHPSRVVRTGAQGGAVSKRGRGQAQACRRAAGGDPERRSAPPAVWLRLGHAGFSETDFANGSERKRFRGATGGAP